MRKNEKTLSTRAFQHLWNWSTPCFADEVQGDISAVPDNLSPANSCESNKSRIPFHLAIGSRITVQSNKTSFSWGIRCQNQCIQNFMARSKGASLVLKSQDVDCIHTIQFPGLRGEKSTHMHDLHPEFLSLQLTFNRILVSGIGERFPSHNWVFTLTYLQQAK